jgi:Domain of unknown function (DUF4430)
VPRRIALLVACALALAGCGLGEGDERAGAGAELRITRDFGRTELGVERLSAVREGQTVMRFLRSRFDIETRFGGRFVQSIEGLSGLGAGATLDWFYFVNGIEADVGAAEYELSPGDRVQWDRRNWEATMRVPAIVGAFPEPFRHGIEGKRLPVRVECEDPAADPCEEVKQRLRRVGVSSSGSALGVPGGMDVIRVVVGLWSDAKVVRAVAELEGEPKESGVFARVTRDGASLELLDESGRAARVAPRGAGTGIVAAARPEEDELVWMVIALDEQGLEAAASAVDEDRLKNAFAVAASGEEVEKLPLASAEGGEEAAGP